MCNTETATGQYHGDTRIGEKDFVDTTCHTSIHWSTPTGQSLGFPEMVDGGGRGSSAGSWSFCNSN